MDNCGIDHRMTSPYHPQASGLTERANQTVTRSLIKMTKDDPDCWDKQIPTVLMGYRASKQASTKYSPFYMLHGHEMVLPINSKGRTVGTNHGEMPDSFLDSVFGPSKAVLKDCLANISSAQDTQAAHYARKQLHGSVTVKDHDPQPPEATVRTPAKSHPVATLTPAHHPTPVPSSPAVTKHVPSSAPTVSLPVTIENTPTPNKQATPNSPCKRTSDAPSHSKRRNKTELQVDDFIVVKVHKLVRKEGDRKGKLAPKVEGPYMVAGFTDENKQVAIIKDADGQTWTRRVVDLSLWE